MGDEFSSVVVITWQDHHYISAYPARSGGILLKRDKNQGKPLTLSLTAAGVYRAVTASWKGQNSPLKEPQAAGSGR